MELFMFALILVALILVFQRWFWILVFGFGSLASFFTVLASIIHFQILGAVGFTILTFFLSVITHAIAEGGE